MAYVRSAWLLYALATTAAIPQFQAVACPFNDPDHCQPFDDSLNYVPSDPDLGRYGLGQLAADDFVPTEDTLTSVCVWGFYVDQDPQAASDDCGPLAFDHFRVRVYSNHSGTGRRPNFFRGESLATSQRVVLPDSQVETALGNQMYEFSLSLMSPIDDLTPGQVYWLEVTNDVDDLSSPTCRWYWSQRVQSPSSYSFTGPEFEYSAGREVPFDNAFCTNFTLGESPVGSMPGACCICGGACSERTLADCVGMNEVWHITNPTCQGVTCGSTPLNDLCANAAIITEGEYVFPHECAATDGYGPIDTDMGLSQIEGDVWYSFTAPFNCQLTVSTCSTGASLDPVLAVYHNPDDPTTCPPCALLSDLNGAQVSAATLAGQGQDENCTNASIFKGGMWVDSWELGRTALPGECFLIRAGGYPGGRDGPSGILSVDCQSAERPPPLEPDPTGINRTRFISFQVPPHTAAIGETSIRIQLTTLHHVVPQYCELCDLPFTLFEGQHVWVGPPTQYVESVSTGTTFLAAFAQCTPHYQNWSTVGFLHVTGTAIVPSSTYHVEQVAAACQGREADSNCQTSGANVSPQLQIRTTRWADVVAPFNPPAITVQPDFSDVSALLDKFRSTPGAPIKAQALLVGTDEFGSIDIATDFGFQHISACVDAFRGHTYVHRMGRCATGGGPCTFNSDCIGTGSAPPCELYCP